jgi:hypothetical protein
MNPSSGLAGPRASARGPSSSKLQIQVQAAFLDHPLRRAYAVYAGPHEDLRVADVCFLEEFSLHADRGFR